MTLRFDRRRFLQTSAAGAALATMPGLMQAAKAQDIAPGGALRLGLNITPSVLNPMLTRLNSEYMLAELLYSGLTMLAADMSAQPDLATEWSANEDATEWRFALRENAVFSNGEKLTSADVVASFAKLLDPATAAPGSRNLGPISEVVADGDYGVIVRTAAPYADLPVSLTYPTAKILPASIIEEDFESFMRTPIGTGPFVLAEYRPDDVAIVERNPNYFIEGQPYLDRVEIKTYPDAAGAAGALLAGELEILIEIQPTDYARIAESAGVTGMRTPSGRFLDVVMDCSVAPFDNPKVREALSCCVDREAMVELVAEGYGTPGNDQPVNAAYRFHADAPLKSYDPEKSRALLAEAGHPDGLKLELIASTKPGYRSAMAVVLREMAGPGGFDIEVKTMDHPSYLEQVWKKGKFYVGFYNMQPTEGAIFNLLFTSDASWNETRWNNAAFDELVAQAAATTDDAMRAELYAKAQGMMRDDVPALIPCFFDLLGARADYVENYEQNPRGANFALHKVSLAANAPTR